jgi:DNA-binding MarR family transcriptional regulator
MHMLLQDTRQTRRLRVGRAARASPAAPCHTGDVEQNDPHPEDLNTASIVIALADDPREATLTTSRALLGVVARSLIEAVEIVSLPQFRVLVILASSGPMRTGALAQRVGAVPSTFTRFVDRMVKDGWVHRGQSPDSRREVLIHLSERGERLVADVTDRRRHEIAAILARLSPEDRRAVGRAFAIFAAAAGEPPPEDLLLLGL